MDILLIGTDGQLANSLCEAEMPPGLRLRAFGLPELDLTDAASIERTFEASSPGMVINVAAYTAVDRAETEEKLAFAINAEGPGIIAGLCAKADIPLIHVSTDYVFDGAGQGPYAEDAPVAPLGVYGRTKLEGEQRVVRTCPKHVILRTAWVYSPFGHNFVKTMLRLADERDELSVVSDQIGNPTYAPHLADAILAIARQLAAGEAAAPWGVYHAAGQGEASWHDLACAVFAASKAAGGPSAVVKPITTADYPTPAKRPANSRLDGAKLRRVFGLALPDWHHGVEACVARLLAA